MHFYPVELSCSDESFQRHALPSLLKCASFVRSNEKFLQIAREMSGQIFPFKQPVFHVRIHDRKNSFVVEEGIFVAQSTFQRDGRGSVVSPI